MKEYPRPVITSDIIVVNEYKEVLLIKRAKDPFKDCWALPGGHFDVDTDESILSCACRELLEETNIKRAEDLMFLLGVYDKKGRDERGRYVSFCYITFVLQEEIENIVADDDASEAKWFSIYELPTLAFDHLDMIKEGEEQWI